LYFQSFTSRNQARSFVLECKIKKKEKKNNAVHEKQTKIKVSKAITDMALKIKINEISGSDGDEYEV
jgi:hypothetical protein